MQASDNNNQDDNSKSGLDVYLTDPDDVKDDESYIKPNIEIKLLPNKRNECREVVQEIKKFGISQRQYLYLIYLLSLELEDINIMKALTTTIGNVRDNIPVSRLVVNDD